MIFVFLTNLLARSFVEYKLGGNRQNKFRVFANVLRRPADPCGF